MKHAQVIVVGAGPVGLFAALRLAQAGVEVKVFEREPALGTRSKASTFHASTLELLGLSGIGTELVNDGLVVDALQWRTLRSIIAEVPFSLLAEDTRFPFRVHAEQWRLCTELSRSLQSIAPGALTFSSEVVGVTQDDRSAGVEVEADGRRRVYQADIVFVADGAQSGIRGALGVETSGGTYPSRTIRVFTDTDLDEVLPGIGSMTYLRDPGALCSLLRMRDHWRMIFRVVDRAPDEELLQDSYIHPLVQRISTDIAIDGYHMYGNRSGVAERFVVGRVVLMGDAAHVTTTAGGMNMNCGLHDAFDFARVASAICAGVGDLGSMEAVGARRREAVVDAVIPRSEARAAGTDGSGVDLARATEDVRSMAKDPALARSFLFGASMLDTSPLRYRNSPVSA